MKKLILNPFERFAGGTSVIIGATIIAITCFISYLGKIHLDGPVDLHAGDEPISITLCVAESLTDWLSVVILLYAAGLIFSKSSIRLIDVLGTQAMARFPYLIAVIFSSFLYSNKMLRYIEFKFMQKGEPVDITAIDSVSFGGMLVVTLLCMVWMIALMYKAYSVSCNIKGTKGIISFIICIILAEVLSALILLNF